MGIFSKLRLGKVTTEVSPVHNPAMTRLTTGEGTVTGKSLYTLKFANGGNSLVVTVFDKGILASRFGWGHRAQHFNFPDAEPGDIPAIVNQYEPGAVFIAQLAQPYHK